MLRFDENGERLHEKFEVEALRHHSAQNELMALFDQLTTADGTSFPMWGVLPGSVTLQKRLAALGPQQLELPGGVLRGHAFHYSTVVTSLTPVSRTTAAPGKKLRGEGEALYVHGPSGAVQASYFHAWFASNPAAAVALFARNPA